MEDLKELFGKFESLKVGVVGDVMLDTYMWGQVDRISPEAPVPIVTLKKKEQRIGGAGNVALNLQSLGAKAFVLSVTGEDEDAATLNKLLGEHLIDTRYSLESVGRITTNKIRVIGRNQQMMRLDGEITTDLDTRDEALLLERFREFIEKEQPQVVILEDYNKGVLTKAVISEVITRCRKKGIITAVDPKRNNFFEYKDVDLFKPNLKEAKEALNLLAADTDLDTLHFIHNELNKQLRNRVSLITLSEKGVFYQQEGSSAIIPSHVRNVSDVSGAGDTVIAVATMVYAISRKVHLMAEIANIAGGLVCEEVGTVAIDRIRLLHESELLLS